MQTSKAHTPDQGALGGDPLQPAQNSSKQNQNQNQNKQDGNESTEVPLKKAFPRTVTRNLKIHETSEGIGSRIRRCIGNRAVRCLPPFVICEQFRMDETGRPPHPARGAQKITYVLSGKVRVEYSPANTIELGPGDVTSLMVGKGVIRSIKASPTSSPAPEAGSGSSLVLNKKPLGKRKATATGLQLFMDVPEPFKRIEPSHLNLCHTDIVTCVPTKGCVARILTGSAFGKKAEQMLTATPALILDCTLNPGASLDIPVKLDWNAFAYVIEGQAHIQGEKAPTAQYVEFMRSPRNEVDVSEDGTEKDPASAGGAYVTIAVHADATQDARVLFCAAKPLCQPIYRQGPFVDVSMNWIHQAFDDYIERKNGFESGEWNSHRPLAYNTQDRPSSVTTSAGFSHPRSDPSPSKPHLNNTSGTDSSSNASASTSASASASNSANASNSDGGSKCSKSSSKDHKQKNRSSSWEESPPYNPCEENGDCSADEKAEKQAKKASFPNAFPPGSINPASHSTAFNNVDGIEEQQEQKVPRRAQSPRRKRRRASESCESDVSDTTASTASPPPKK